MSRSNYIAGSNLLPLPLVLLGLLLSSLVQAQEPELLPPDQAFVMEHGTSPGIIRLDWRVAPGYFMYRERFKFSLSGNEIPLEQAAVPRGEAKNDPIFGDVEVLRERYTVELPWDGSAGELRVTSQGCADIGVCYPPQTITVSLQSSPSAGASSADPLAFLGGSDTTLAQGGGGDTSPDAQNGEFLSQVSAAIGGNSADFLPPDLAFVVSTFMDADGTLVARWDVAEGYYLYKHRFGAEVVQPTGLEVRELALPTGTQKTDEYFGDVEVFYGQVEARIALSDNVPAGQPVEVQLAYQGCADAGLCYPPIKQVFSFMPGSGGAVSGGGDALSAQVGGVAELAEQDAIARSLSADNLLWSLAAFFGFGLLLTFTPCVLPMIPILSSIIVGQGQSLSTARAFVLSATYVLAMATTYAAIGVAAGLLGSGLQAAFQNPFVLIAFSAVFVWLAGAMFGYYEISLPGRWQSGLAAFSNRQRAGSHAGVAVMGVLSALIVGPCVAAPLAGALIYIGQTGDALLGGAALFTLSLGMGVPLLIVGTSAGRLLPRVGAWMDSIKALFGFILLGVAVYLLERVVPEWLNMLMWAGLLIAFALYHGLLDGVRAGLSRWQKTLRVAGWASALYGGLILVGVASGATDPLRPLHKLVGVQETHLAFERVTDVAGLEAALAKAREQGRSVMLDYYADWCVSCKEMEEHTFTDVGVQKALGNTLLLQVDVTRNSDEDQALLRRYGLYGPPAILFFGRDGAERARFRLVGFVPAEDFATHVRKATS